MRTRDKLLSSLYEKTNEYARIKDDKSLLSNIQKNMSSNECTMTLTCNDLTLKCNDGVFRIREFTDSIMEQLEYMITVSESSINDIMERYLAIKDPILVSELTGDRQHCYHASPDLAMLHAYPNNINIYILYVMDDDMYRRVSLSFDTMENFIIYLNDMNQHSSILSLGIYGNETVTSTQLNKINNMPNLEDVRLSGIGHALGYTNNFLYACEKLSTIDMIMCDIDKLPYHFAMNDSLMFIKVSSDDKTKILNSKNGIVFKSVLHGVDVK